MGSTSDTPKKRKRIQHKTKKLTLHGACPVTAGQKTRMLEAAFIRMCECKRSVAAEPLGPHGFDYKNSRCLVCKGERRHWPAELELLAAVDLVAVQHKPEDLEIIDMTRARKCDACGESKPLKSNRGKQVCSTCAALYGAVAHRPELVLQVLGELHPELVVGQASGQDAVDNQEQSEAWWAITRAMGLDLDATSSPMEVARAVVQTVAMLHKEGGRRQGTIQQLEKENKELRVQLDDAQKAWSGAKGRLEDVASRLGVELGEEAFAASRLASQVTLLEEKLSRAEAAGGVLSPAVETVLLDLVLDALKGQITGLTPERIEALRGIQKRHRGQ